MLTHVTKYLVQIVSSATTADLSLSLNQLQRPSLYNSLHKQALAKLIHIHIAIHVPSHLLPSPPPRSFPTHATEPAQPLSPHLTHAPARPCKRPRPRPTPPFSPIYTTHFPNLTTRIEKDSRLTVPGPTPWLSGRADSKSGRVVSLTWLGGVRCRGRKFDSEGDVVPREKTRLFLFWCSNAFILRVFQRQKRCCFFLLCFWR